MDRRLRLSLLASPLAVFAALAMVPEIMRGTAWAILLLASILASGFAYSRR